MLGTVSQELDAKTELIDRIRQEAESIAYVAPEHRAERLAQIVAAIRRDIRKYDRRAK